MASLVDAATYLTPRQVCLAIAASSASAGRLCTDALPVLAALVSSPSTAAPTFRHLIDTLDPLVLHPTDSSIVDDDPDDMDDEEETVAEFLDATISTIDCVDALLNTIDNLIPPDDEYTDSDMANLLYGVYDRDGRVACLLRTVVVMAAGLSFEAAVDLVEAIHAYSAGDAPPSPAPMPAAANVLPPSSQISAAASADADAAARALALGNPVQSDDAYERLTHAPPRYAAHLEALRRRDYGAAMHSLHRHFDLSLTAIAASSAGGAGVGSDARGHQYAALSLAAAHFHLGHPRLANAALHDALRAAQQCGDEVCQAQAQAWIARTSPSPEQRHELFRHARNRIALAREELVTVVTPAAKDERITVDGVDGESFWRRETRLLAAVSAARMVRIHEHVGFQSKTMSVSALLVSAAAWESHAALPTALVVARMALRKAGRREPVPAKQRIQRGVMDADEPQVLTADEALAMVAVAALEAKSGRSGPAIAKLLGMARSADSDRIKPDFAPDQSSSRPERDRLTRCATWLQFEQSLRCGETCVAGRFVETIAAYVPPSVSDAGDAIGGADAELDAIEVRVRWHLAAQAFEEAVKDAELLSLRAASLSQPARVIDGSRFLADALIGSGAANSAIPHALSAVSLARGLGLEAAHVKSVLTLTTSMLRMDGGGSAESALAASRTLDAVLPRALEGLGVSERGTARRLQAECVLARASGGCGAAGGVADEAIDALRDAIEAFTVAGDRFGLRDCWYILARVYHEVGNVQGRAEASAAFRSQVEALAAAQVAC